MLVAQAMVEGMVLVTSDRRLAGYPVAVLQV
jgi:PIN domain nuclease of toxin-antitoxin system